MSHPRAGHGNALAPRASARRPSSPCDDRHRSMRHSESAITLLGIIVSAAAAFVMTWIIANRLGASATGDFFLFTSIFTITAGVVGIRCGYRPRTHALGGTGEERPHGRCAPDGPCGACSGGRGRCRRRFARPRAGPPRRWPSCSAQEHHGASTVRVLAVALLPGALVGVLLAGSRGLGHILSYTAVQNLFVPFARLAAVAVAAYVVRSEGLVVWAWSLPLVVRGADRWPPLEKASRPRRQGRCCDERSRHERDPQSVLAVRATASRRDRSRTPARLG